MSNFPSIEEFDSGHVTATKAEDTGDNLLDSAEDDFLAREQAVLGDDADFFQSGGTTTSPPTQGGAAFLDENHGNVLSLWVVNLSDEDIHEFETSFPSLQTNVRFPPHPKILIVEWISGHAIPLASVICAGRRT
jgi:hypothetical protein